jgi:flagella basal body P-ring formation protein FlgA
MKPNIAVTGLMRSLAMSLIGASLGLPSLPAAGPVELRVERDRITAGQLARVIPAWADVAPATVLAYAPRPGARRHVARSELVRWGRDQGLDLEHPSLPESLLVRRASRQLSSAEARDLVLNSLAAGFETSKDKIHVEIENYRPTLLPAGDLDFKSSPRNLILNRVTPLPIEWVDADGWTGRFLVRASVTVQGQYAVAKRGLPAGTELRPDDLRFEQGPLPGAPERFAVSPPDVNGMELRGSLPAGRPLDRRLLVAAKTIKRGDLIQIRMRSGAVVLQTPAQAEESGSVGAQIRCRNLDSGRRIVARVVSQKIVEVSVP